MSGEEYKQKYRRLVSVFYMLLEEIEELEKENGFELPYSYNGGHCFFNLHKTSTKDTDYPKFSLRIEPKYQIKSE